MPGRRIRAFQYRIPPDSPNNGKIALHRGTAANGDGSLLENLADSQ